jgi:predicted lipoprotein with Yx(FWY)xxD motif
MIDFRKRQVPTQLLVLVVVAAAAGFAAIGATARTISPTMTIGTRHTTKAGVILVGPRGQTLYSFNRDRGDHSSCYGRCARNWPPLRATCRPIAMPSSGVKQKWLSTTRRRDGTLRVTYQGHPLYVNGGDTKPGSLEGDNAHEFGGIWYAIPVRGVDRTPA